MSQQQQRGDQQQSAFYAQLQVLSDKVSRVAQMVVDFRNAVLADFQSSAQMVADRLYLVSDAISNQCDDDGSDETSNLAVPVHEAQLLDALRASQSPMYAALLAAAERLNDADVFSVRQVLSESLQSMLNA